jgi:hypothetical protein
MSRLTSSTAFTAPYDFVRFEISRIGNMVI